MRQQRLSYGGDTMLIVQKFGGTSLEGRERIFAAARIITQAAKRGSRVVAVVSAQGQTTDDMIAQAISIHPRVTAREMDAYLSTGEQVSAASWLWPSRPWDIRWFLSPAGRPAIHTDGTHGNARILGLGNDRILQELDRDKIVLVAGFQGVNQAGDITTLGPGWLRHHGGGPGGVSPRGPVPNLHRRGRRLRQRPQAVPRRHEI